MEGEGRKEGQGLVAVPQVRPLANGICIKSKSGGKFTANIAGSKWGRIYHKACVDGGFTAYDNR